MSTKQGYIKDFEDNKMLPETTTVMVTDVARSQALSASMLALVEKNALGFPDFTTTEEHPVGQEVFYDRKLWKFTAVLAENVDWDATKVREFSLKEYVDALKAAIEDGTVPAKLAENLESWEGEAMSRDYVQTSYVETTGGDISIDSSLPANLKSVVPTTDFFASQLISTGFNLLRRATAVGNGWYFEVPHLVATQQSIGTALQNNGVLFTNSNHANLTPTVYFKALSAGVPTSVTDGVAATYTDKNGRRHYTTSGAGYLIVSGIDRASVCAHIGWSRRYDDYISVADAADAGAVVDMAARRQDDPIRRQDLDALPLAVIKQALPEPHDAV